MNTYLAESEDGGIDFTHGYDAESWDDAELIAKKRGWVLVCEIPNEELCFTLELEPQIMH